MAGSNELRLFLSSTFVDFQSERDYLAKKVFPALRRQCRERGIEFTEIDLRWGLTDEDAEHGLILGTCFEEIDRCRPFFVGMLGDRYGWVPPMDELTKNPELSSEYPWLRAALREGKSATEMEFLHGFLNSGPGKIPPLIYFRSAKEASDPRVEQLKANVVAALGNVPSFETPQELGELLERDLSHLLDVFWPASKSSGWLEEERAGHMAFAQSRRKGYVPNPALLAQLDSHFQSDDSVLVITGESGSGKSSLLSYWAESLRSNHPEQQNPFIIEHFVGVTAVSTDPDILMRRIIEEIRERVKSEDPVPQSSTELTQVLPSWLGRISNEPMIILVDAINQFNTDGRFLRWLPEYSSANIKWVISSTQGEALDRLRTRGRAHGHSWREITVDPISVNERKHVLRAFLATYQKKLIPAQEEWIVNDEKASNPLFLRTLLEELRLQGKHEELESLIRHYLHSRDIPDLFARILERLESDYGRNNVRTFLTRVWAAPHGLSETELMGSSDLDRAAVSHLLHAFDYHLVRLKGRLSFFHDHLRAGVENRYLFSSQQKNAAWTELARYFECSEASTMKALTLPWLWKQASRWSELRRSLLDIDLLRYLADGSHSYELLAYWLALEKEKEAETSSSSPGSQSSVGRSGWTLDVVREYEIVLNENGAFSTRETEREIRYRLALFFRNAGWHDGAVISARRALELCEDSDVPEVQAQQLDICLELGKAYLDLGNLESAGTTLEKALRLLGDERAQEANPAAIKLLSHINIRNEYARLLKEQGKYAEAELVSRINLDAALKQFGSNHAATQNEMRWLAEILSLQGKYPEAEALHRKVLKSIEASLGPESLEAGYYRNELANFIRLFGGDYVEAEQLFERAVTVIQNRLGSNHPDLAILYQNLGSLYTLLGKWEPAETLFNRNLTIIETAYGPNHPSTAVSLNNYAALLYFQQKYELAEVPYRRALAIRQQAYGEQHPITAEALNNLGNLFRRMEKYEDAEQCYRTALSIRIATIGPNHDDTARSRAAYGALLHSTGKLEESEDLLNQAYEVRKSIRGIKHSDTLSAAVELAEVFLEESKYENASKIIEEILSGIDSIEDVPNVLRDRFLKIQGTVELTI